MRFWKTLIPDEPLISDSEVVPARYMKNIPPAVKSWCLVSIITNAVVIAVATMAFRNAVPLLAGAIFTLFPLYMLAFRSSLASTVGDVKQRAIERSPLVVVNLSLQWAAISICVFAPMMTCVLCILLWSIQMNR